MLTVTDAACERLSELLTDTEAPDGSAVRLIVGQNNLEMRLDNERPGDATYEHSGKTVLVVDENMSKLLEEKTLDIEQTTEGPKMKLT